MSDDNAQFVLVHGAWHSHHTWDALIPELAARGFEAVTLDLPGQARTLWRLHPSESAPSRPSLPI